MPKTIEKQRQVPMIRESAYQIWLAGLGALSLAEDESGKVFKTLVKRGKAFETNAKGRVDEIKEKLDVRKAANETMTKLGDTLDDSVTEVLHRLGLPTKKEIDGLAKRVDRLTRSLEMAPTKRVRRARRMTKRVAAQAAEPETTD